MKYISIILLIISIILSLVIYYYINANIIEKFNVLNINDFNNIIDFSSINNRRLENKKEYNNINEIIENTLEPQLKIITDTIERYNSFEDTINGYGFL